MSVRSILGLGVGALLAAACGGNDLPPAASPAPATGATAEPSTTTADPPPVTEGPVTVATVHGITVLVQRVPGAEFVEGNLYIRGGVRNLTEANQGIEALGLQASVSGGTQALAKEPFTRKLESIAATLNAEARADLSMIGAKAPTANWDATFDLLTATFLTPALPTSEIELVRARMAADLKHERETGDGRLNLAARKSLYAGHPYMLRTIGTPESIAAITPDAVAPHLAKLRQTNRLVLVVVGDVDAAHVENQVARAFAGVPAGDYQDTPVPPLTAKNTFVKDADDIPTSYVQTSWAGPTWNDPDFAPAWIGMSLLSFRLFEEVRTKRNLSYAPYARFQRSSARPFGYLYVTAVDPETTMTVMMNEARRLQDEPVSDKEFAAQKSMFVTTFVGSQETTEGRAELLGNALLLGGDWHLADLLLKRVKATTPADVQRAAKTMMVGLNTAIVGHPEKLDPATVQMQGPAAPAPR